MPKQQEHTLTPNATRITNYKNILNLEFKTECQHLIDKITLFYGLQFNEGNSCFKITALLVLKQPLPSNTQNTEK